MFGNRQPYQGFNFFNRLKALSIHLIFSLIVFAIFMVIMLVYWYPAPHFQMNGGWQGTRIMIAVDLVIGPLLTFFLYNNRKSKKELRFDLGIIIIAQIGLIIYGVSQVYSQRPIAQVLSHRGYIATPRQEDLLYQTSVNPNQMIHQFNILGIYPPMVFSVFDDYHKKKTNLFKDNFSIKKDESARGNFNPEVIVSRYRPLHDPRALSDIRYAQERAMKRFRVEPKNKDAIDKYKKQHGNQFYFFPLRGEYGNAVMVLDKQTLKPIDYFNIELYD